MYHNPMPPFFPAVTHFAVTVSDLERSIVWYEALFETPAFFVGDETTYRFAVWLEPSLALHVDLQVPTGRPSTSTASGPTTLRSGAPAARSSRPGRRGPRRARH